MNYLVMETGTAYAVVLGEDGSFRKVANLRYEVGQTVADVIPLNLPEVPLQSERHLSRWVRPLAAMAACMVLLLTGIFWAGQLPYASVYLTINPEVRIDVNRRDRVVAVEGGNADGEQLLAGYHHGRKDLDTVMDELVDRAMDMGYLHQGGRIILDLQGDDAWVAGHEDHLDRHLTEHLADRITVTIDVAPKAPPAATVPGTTIVIPMVPEHQGGSDYGESDYGASDYGGSDYGDSGYGDSPYEAPEGDDSGYGAPEPEADDTDYAGESVYADQNSGYGESDYGGGWDGGDSGYSDGGDSGYEEADD